jgi:HEAT repeat protein
MSPRSALRFVLAATLILSPSLIVNADDPPDDADEILLMQANCPCDDATLLSLFRPAPPPSPVDPAPLIRRLNHDRFDEREAASRQLVALGEAALPQLREACGSRDPETARRAAYCCNVIEGQAELRIRRDVLTAAMHLLGRRHPAGATAALLEYLPRAATPEAEEEVWYALDAVAAATVEPALVEALADREPARRAAAACLLGRLGDEEQKRAVRRLLKDQDAGVRLRAAQGLLAGRDTAGVTALVELLADSPLVVGWQAEELLRWLAGPAAPREPVGSGNLEQRAKCREAWRNWLAANPTKADPVAAFASTRRPGFVQRRLVQIGFPPTKRNLVADINYPLEALDSPAPEERRGAVVLFQHHKHWAIDALPRLFLLLHDPDEGVRIEAARTMGFLGPRASAAVPALIELLAGGGQPALSAGEALRLIGPRALPALRKALTEDRRPHVRFSVVQVLAQMEEEADPALPELWAAAKDENAQVQKAALEAIRRRGSAETRRVKEGLLTLVRREEPEDVAELWEMLTNNSYPIILSAIRRVTKSKTSDPMIVGELIHILRDYHEQECVLRSEAALALGGLGPNGRDAIPLLMQLSVNRTPSDLFDMSFPVRPEKNAAYRLDPAAIARIGIPHVGLCALIALSEQAAYSADVRWLLLRICADPTDIPGHRWIAAAGLRTVGPAQADLLPGIIKLAKDENVPLVVRLNLIEAVGNMGPAAKEAAPLLRNMAEEGDRPVRKVAREALARLCP